MAQGHKDDIHRTPDVAHIQNPDVTHEESDVNVRAILIFTGGLLAMAIIVHVLMYFMFELMQDRQKKLEPTPPPMAVRSDEEQLPQGPRLQAARGYEVKLSNGETKRLELREPEAERNELDRMWQDELKNGRKDSKTGQAISIPIEEAKQKLLAGSGLPARPQQGAGPSPSAHGIELPTYASSGRATEKREP